jgi:ABC-2 type transport system permease protein
MRVIWTLARRELGGYLLSWTGYIIISAALFMMGFSFVILLLKLQQDPTPMPVTELFYITQFFWLIILLAAPVITMRLFALEKFSGTYETLMTTPVSDFQVVVAKFSAALVFYLLMWLPLIGCMFVVRYFSRDSSAIDAGTIASTFVGIVLLGGLFISLGCCASALTKSQVAAAMMGLVFGATIFFLGFVADKVPNPSSWQGQAAACFKLFDQMHDFARGVIDTRPVVLLVSLTLFILFLTLRIVESRRWK